MQKPALTLIGLALVAMPARAEEISIFAAASMKDAINELADAFAAKHPDVVFQKNFGASGALAKQIENGAPADIFISANTEWVDYLKEKKFVDGVGSLRVQRTGIRRQTGSEGYRPADVVKLERIAIGSPKSVPAGHYAMQAFKKAGLDTKLEKKLVMAKDVRECMLYADRGEVTAPSYTKPTQKRWPTTQRCFSPYRRSCTHG